MVSRCMLMLASLLIPEAASAEPVTIFGVTITFVLVLKVLAVVVVIIILILIFDYAGSFFHTLFKKPCKLLKRTLAPNICAGECTTPGQTCNETEQESYMIFWKQAKSCACGLPPAGEGSGSSEKPGE
ncbi:MAG: hypothetical protein RQ867_06325 [Mariprofundaceae bacterium]|nr:hypothetical protein [Mariprofundaceae bacterium]